MDKFIIKGGRPLEGKIEARGAKNAATPILAACLLTDQPCVIDNLPLIDDVFRMIDILKSIGVKIEYFSERKIKLQADNLSPDSIDYDSICKLRSSILLLGPLLARVEKFKMSHPGGCLIGARPVATHFEGLATLGAQISQDDQFYYIEKKQFSDADQRQIILREFSVTATENLMMVASLRPGKTVIKIAAAEPHVQDLGEFLIKMGAKIEGLGTHTLVIQGAKKLSGAEHRLIPDPIEGGTFVVAAAATKGEVLVENFRADHLDLFLEKLREMRVNFEIGQNSIFVKPSTSYRAAKIQTLPYPGIPTDLQAPLAVLCTQAEGTSLIHDPLYEGRFKYINELAKMGANATVVDPHRALVVGPTPLYGTQITSYDLRAGATLIIAALLAEGVSEISEIYQVDRGYEKIEERLQRLGVDIKRVNE